MFVRVAILSLSMFLGFCGNGLVSSEENTSDSKTFCVNYLTGDYEVVSRVFGGSKAKVSDYPFAVLIITSVQPKKIEICSGSIISRRCVLTAAHCTHRTLGYASYNVFAGTDKGTGRTEEDNERMQARCGIAKYRNHPKYRDGNKGDDISLFFVAERFYWTPYVKPVPISNGPFPSDGKACKAVGWGRTEIGGGGKFLKWVTLWVTPPYVGCVPSLEVAENLLCARGNPGRQICVGDSGGAIVCDNVVAAVVKAVIKRKNKTDCDDTYTLSIAVDVTNHLDWIVKYVPDVMIGACYRNQMIRSKPVQQQIPTPQKNENTTNKMKKEQSEVVNRHPACDNEITLLSSLKTEDVGKTKKKKTTTKAKLLAQEQEKVNHLRKQHKLTINGAQVPAPVASFEELQARYDLSEKIIANLTNSGYKEPTPIQMQAIPAMLEGRQILACAPTGSGKTAAFLVPIIHRLGRPRRRGFRAVVVSPTRELAKQTFRECIRLSEGTGLRCHIISKVGQAATKFGLQSSQRFDILVTTPNRLIYLLRQEPTGVSLANVEWLVIDESDKLFEAGPQGFRDQLAEIYRTCDADNCLRAMFSATHTPDVARWARKNLHRLISVTVGHRNAAVEIVEQELMFVGSEHGKLVAFRDMVQKGLTPPVLVFVQSKERAKELFTELIYDGINVDVIHADRTQLQRDNVVRSFREGNIWVLICTELMGRGIDFKGVNLVVNYDFPPSAISYIHRIGRTGRAGRPGKAITFFTQDDAVNLRSIAQVMRDSGCDVPDFMLKMKKPGKRVRQRLETKAPYRDTISTEPTYEREKKEWQKYKLKSRKRKREMDNSETPLPKQTKMPTDSLQ